jgi:hypothetical protein
MMASVCVGWVSSIIDSGDYSHGWCVEIGVRLLFVGWRRARIKVRCGKNEPQPYGLK